MNEMVSKHTFKRITIIVGHYGSGKSEFAMNYALYLAGIKKNIYLVDLDIASPYFRTREKSDFLKDKNITPVFNNFGMDIGIDLPALSPVIFGCLEDGGKTTIIDCGGDKHGARILNQLKRFLPEIKEYEVLFVLNRNRDETSSLAGVARHIEEIEEETGLKITGLVNNTHMLTETSWDDVIYGNEICMEIAEKMKLRVEFTCIAENLLTNDSGYEIERDKLPNIFPMHIYLREKWHDL